MSDVLALLNQWGPWVLLTIGVVCLPFSTVFYQQYLDCNKKFLNSQFFCRWGSLFCGADWTRQVRDGFDKRAEVTPGKMWASVVFCFVEIGVALIWMWLRQ